jgi:L-lactate dehydrogenase complex protein LldG
MDTSIARKAIFDRIRQGQKRSGETLELERDVANEYLQKHPEGPRPALGTDLVKRFKEQALRMSDTVEEVTAWSDVPTAVAHYLDGIQAGKRAVAWPTLEKLPWTETGIQIEVRTPTNEDAVGITGSFCAVAETGSLLLLSGPDAFVSASLLPETHIAIVQASRIVAAMEDAFSLMRTERGELPRTASFISGPSRTGDIEQTIVLGAHGPARVHVIIVHQA